ncbi:MAG: hypothetical protein D6820_09215 [Lentisphaerae bacterium]|nr:MAG: hypothetical protein D6820_09215 [Lentisphaerota bacterium]
MRTIMILMDSLNRRFLSAYGNNWVKTPNIDRLVRRGATFDNHYVGSLPCMPARRDIMTGRLSFLENPWGPIEIWDDCVPAILKQHRTYTHMITDHYHYFHRGGAGYHYLFSSWEFIRGQEFDVWRPVVNPGPEPKPGTRNYRGLKNHAFRANRAHNFWDREKDEDYPTVKSFDAACEFIELNHNEDNWHLHLEVFDPHEPFECPSHYRQLYGDDYEGEEFYFPEYAPLSDEDDPAVVDHIRKRYAGSLTMADRRLGRLLDRLDKYDMWKDTVVILTTDHGHLLGEHRYWAKNYMMVYQELAHIPLIVCAPQIKAPTRVQALTTTIDIAPTILELHNAPMPPHLQGKSLVHLFTDPMGQQHDSIIFGYFAKDVNWTDGRYVYCRQPTPGKPCYMHTANPFEYNGISRERLSRDDVEFGIFLPTAYGIPHYRIPVPSSRHHNAPETNLIFDLKHDYHQEHPIDDPNLETELETRLRAKLQELNAPQCQFDRLNL